MAMSVLEIIARMTNAVGVPEPSTAVANQNEDVQQLVELLNQEGRQLSKRGNWQALTFEASFTSVATESQGTLASIIGATQELRKIINETIWDRTSQQQFYGPLSPRARQASLAQSLSSPFPRYFIRGGTLRMNPAPTAGDTCYFEYVSNMWCTDSAGVTYRRNIAADTDLMLLDDEIMLAGLEWRWLRKKGLSYAEEFQTYEALVATALMADGTKPVIAMDNQSNVRPRGAIPPSGSWSL